MSDSVEDLTRKASKLSSLCAEFSEKKLKFIDPNMGDDQPLTQLVLRAFYPNTPIGIFFKIFNDIFWQKIVQIVNRNLVIGSLPSMKKVKMTSVREMVKFYGVVGWLFY